VQSTRFGKPDQIAGMRTKNSDPFLIFLVNHLISNGYSISMLFAYLIQEIKRIKDKF